MQAASKIAVAGATGRVGRHIMDVLTERGYQAVPISRTHGVDVITGEGLDAALAGAAAVIDAATGPSPEQEAATRFFATAAGNLQAAGERAGVARIVAVSIIGIERFAGGYGVAQAEHERVTLAGPIPARVLRAAQFHELVPQLMQWGRQGDVVRVPRMRTQLVAARSVAETLADLAVADDLGTGPIWEIAGPREERLAEMAALLAARDADPVHIEEGADPEDPNAELYASGALLPGPDAILAGPAFADWLASEPRAHP
jgi:uncharacterized protein YbjT (DUF2867 family)